MTLPESQKNNAEIAKEVALKWSTGRNISLIHGGPILTDLIKESLDQKDLFWREKLGPVVEALKQIRLEIQGNHDAVCVPVWTDYDRCEPNALCHLREEIDKALSLLHEIMREK